MLKFIATDVVISKGYNDKPAIRYSEDGSVVRFRIGKRVYDKREDGNYRWINVGVKAFGELCERIKKMKLSEGSFVHLEGRYDEDKWRDENGQWLHAPVIVLTELEYAYAGGKDKNEADGNGANEPNHAAAQGAVSSSAAHEQEPPQEMPDNFTGFEGFGGVNPFFPQGTTE